VCIGILGVLLSCHGSWVFSENCQYLHSIGNIKEDLTGLLLLPVGYLIISIAVLANHALSGSPMGVIMALLIIPISSMLWFFIGYYEIEEQYLQYQKKKNGCMEQFDGAII
jgi:hypothetical protein